MYRSLRNDWLEYNTGEMLGYGMGRTRGWRYGYGSLYIFITILFFINEDFMIQLVLQPGHDFLLLDQGI
jgi:hypothetical protein